MPKIRQALEFSPKRGPPLFRSPEALCVRPRLAEFSNVADALGGRLQPDGTQEKHEEIR